MSASWREALHLQRWAFPELAYQAIYAVRQGNLLPPTPGYGLAARAQRRVVQSKLLVSALLAFVAAGSALVLTPLAERNIAPALAQPLYVETVISGLLLLELALLWWTGLQVLPAFLSSQVLPTLDTLPVSPRTVERAGFLLFLRLFDLPALTALTATPIAIGLALSSPVAGLAILPGALSAVVFGLALSLVTGSFFLRHVQGSPGGSHRSTVLRWGYLVLWTVPAFAMYGFVSLGPRFIDWLSRAAPAGPSGVVDGLLAAYPFPLASLPSLVATGGVAGPSSGPGPIAVVLAATIVYGLLAVAAGAWLLHAPRDLARATLEGRPTPSVAVVIRARSAPAAIILKDLRIASRTPGFAFLVLLPLLDAIAIGVWTVLSDPGISDAFNIAAAAVATAALLATFFGPAFFAIEVMGYSYTRTLPLSDGSLLLGKVGFIAGLYVLASGTVLAIALTRLFDPAPFASFVLAELPAVVAAALFELGLLLSVARRRGLPITNLYSGSWWAMAVSLPGLFVAGAPLAVFEAVRATSQISALTWMAVVSLAELALAVAFAFAGTRRRGS